VIVAADHAKFGLPEVKVGLFAGAGGVQRLTRQIGSKNAMAMLLTGDPINCEQALAFGLINAAVPYGSLMETALSWAKRMTKASPMAIRSSMQLIHETAHLSSADEAVTCDHNVFDNLLNSEDFYEGSQAFAEKRAPKWTGR